MSAASAGTDAIRELLDSFFGNAAEKNRATLEKFIDMERALVEQYQKYVADELAASDDVLQKFTKLMMTSWVQTMALQRENRARFLELHSSIAEAHLRFLEKIEEKLSSSDERAEGGSSD